LRESDGETADHAGLLLAAARTGMR
jgi:hypothetical protein